MLLVSGAPCQLRSLAGQEHGRTIPLADMPLGRESAGSVGVFHGEGRPYARAWTVLLVQLSVKYDGSKIGEDSRLPCLAAHCRTGQAHFVNLTTRHHQTGPHRRSLSTLWAHGGRQT